MGNWYEVYKWKVFLVMMNKFAAELWVRKETLYLFCGLFFLGSIWMLTHGKLRVFKNLHFLIVQNVHSKVSMKIFFKNMPQKAILHRLCFSIQVNKLQKIPFFFKGCSISEIVFPLHNDCSWGIYVQKLFETNLNQ